MECQMYFDGIGQISVNDGVVRIELMELRPDGEKMKPASCGRLVTTLPGFVRLLGAMGKTADRMVEAGILQRGIAGSGKMADGLDPSAHALNDGNR